MVDAARAARMAGRIQQIVAQQLRSGVKDPRLGMVTVTDVRVTGDLHDATIYYTVFGDDEALASTQAALDSAKGVLRSQVGRQTGVKFTPTLTFVHDHVPDNAHQINELLAEAHQRDAEVEAVRAGKTFAGDADPYRRDEVDAAAADGDEPE